MELWRRIVLVICIGVGMGMAYLACLDPVIIVSPYNKKARIKANVPLYPPYVSGGASSGALLAPEERAVIEARRQPRVLVVEGEAWAEFFQKVTAALERGKKETEWARRLPAGSHPMKALFFRPYEYPLNTLPVTFTKKAERLYLAWNGDSGPQYLDVSYRSYSDSDFKLGSGFSQYPEPPANFLYPHRTVGFLIILAGIAFYVVLPWPGRYPGALGYDRWRVVLGDALAAVFYLFSIAVPILVMGGALQVFPEGLLIFFLFSPFFVGGLLLLGVSAWYGSYRILPTEEGLEITTFRGTRLFRYGDMSFFQPVVFMPPRWLIAASWTAVFLSAGAARFGAAGRALMLNSSFAGSIGIGLRSGAVLFINVTNQMGATSLKGFQAIVETLRRRGVGEYREMKTVRSLGFETLWSPGPEK